MLQLAAALLFAIAAGLGIAVILAMLANNREAILSALAGEGAFSDAVNPQPGATPHAIRLRPSPMRRETPRPVRAVRRPSPVLSRAA